MARKDVNRAPEAPKPEVAPKGAVVIQMCKVDKEGFFKVPERQHAKDAGLDLSVARGITIHPNSKVLIACNIAEAIPAGYYGIIVGRSSVLYQRGLLINLGIIDAGYRGEVQVMAYNPTQRSATLFEGDRVAQLLIMPTIPATFEVVDLDQLPEGDRGAKGFGSTGGYTDLPSHT